MSGKPAADGKLFGFSVMSGGNVVIALLSYFRFAQITAIFGANWRTDALAVAMVFPQLLQEVIRHSFGSAFIPIYSRVIAEKGHELGSRFVSKVVSWIVLMGLVLLSVFWFNSGHIVRFISPNGSAELLSFASVLLRMALPLIILVPSKGILLNFIKCEKRFRILPLSGMINLVVSLGVILIVRDSISVRILPLSMLTGCLVELCFVLYHCRKSGFRFTPSLERDSYLKQLSRMSGPVVFGTLVGFFAPIADKMLASFLPESSVTAVDYANRIKQIVLSVVFSPLLVFADLDFSAEAARGKLESLLASLRKSINTTAMIMYPTAAFLTVLAVPVVSVFFQRGNLSGKDAEYIGYALAFYSPWLAQFGIGSLVSRAFYAQKDSRTPVVIGVFGVVTNVLLNLIFVGPLGIGGLALATTVTSTAKTIYLIWSLSRKMGGLGLRMIAAEQGKLLLSNLVAAGVCLLLLALVPFSTDASFARRSVSLLLYVVSGLSAVTLMLHLTGSRTFADNRRMVISRLKGRIR